MMRLCVILILSCNLFSALFAAEQEALSIDYSSKQLSLDTVLDQLERFAQLETSIDSKILSEHIHKTPISIHLVQADRKTCLQAICHATNQKVWWYSDNQHIYLTRSLTAAPSGELSSAFYTSNVADPALAEPIIREALGPWLAVPKAGLGHVPQQRTWSASLNPQGHQTFKQLLQIFEKQRSDIPACINPSLKRVLAITQAIKTNNWADAGQEIAKQLKCSVSISADLAEHEGAIEIRACLADEIIQVLAGNGVSAAWKNQVLCIGKKHAQTWQHPLQVKPIWIPLSAYKSDEQKRIVERFKAKCPDSYWEQSGCHIQHLAINDACFISAHPSILAVILLEWQHIDSNPKRP